jgi:PAS domain S-box-containing protein
MDLKLKSKTELLAEVTKLRKQIGKLNKKIHEHVEFEKVFQNPMQIPRIMLEYVNDAIYVTQDDFFKFVNSKITQITGYSPKELMEIPAIDFIHPDDRAVIRDRYLRRMHGEEVPNLYPHRILDKQGNVKWIEVNSILITWHGRPAQVSFMRDISERKAAEDALKQSEQLRADIINFLPDPTFAIDDQGRITAWNLAIEELTGIASRDMIGRGAHEYGLALHGERKPVLIDEIIQPSSPDLKRYLSFSRMKEYLIAETEIIYHGKSVTFWCKAGLMKGPDGKVIGAIESLRDITDLKEMNTALKILLKQRENDNREIEEKFFLNIKELVLPHVRKLKAANMGLQHTVSIDIIENHLKEIMSPFLSKLSSKYSRLSPREIQVVSLIRDGMTTKEIAGALNISTNSVDIFRQNIRKKLGINKGKVNLRSFLSSPHNN